MKRTSLPKRKKPGITLKLEAEHLADAVKVYDLTHLQKTRAPKTRVRKGRTVKRDPGVVTGIVLHQTAVKFGVADYQIRQAGGDRSEAKRRRSLNVAGHAVVFRAGWVCLAHPVLSYVHHAGPLNTTTVGLEVEGVYPGLLDDPNTTPREDLLTLWKHKKPDKLDAITIAAARRAVVELKEQVAKAGGHLRYIYAHRQSSWSRRSDPGEALWKEVGEWAVSTLGMKALRDQTFGTGKPIPKEWSVYGVGKY